MEIRLNHLSFSWPDTPVLQELSHTFDSGLYLIRGPSGVGKTTLLRLIAGLIAPDAGTIEAGDRILSEPGSITIPPPERGIMLMSQEHALWPGFSAAGNVAAVLRAHGSARPEVRERTHALLEKVDAVELADRRIDGLSGGQTRRIELARALAANANVLLLDEPFSGLNTDAIAKPAAAVIEYAADHMVLVSAHEAGPFSGHANILELRNGGLIS